jgi:hypothetical protein
MNSPSGINKRKVDKIATSALAVPKPIFACNRGLTDRIDETCRRLNVPNLIQSSEQLRENILCHIADAVFTHRIVRTAASRVMSGSRKDINIDTFPSIAVITAAFQQTSNRRSDVVHKTLSRSGYTFGTNLYSLSVFMMVTQLAGQLVHRYALATSGPQFRLDGQLNRRQAGRFHSNFFDLFFRVGGRTAGIYCY